MRTIDLLCLANSKKLGGRCLAGVVLPEMTEWVRPVDGTRLHGEVPDSRVQVRTPEGHRAVRPLDKIRVVLTAPQPTPFQPENWVLSPAPSGFVEVADLETVLPTLRAISNTGDGVLDLEGEKSVSLVSASRGLSRSIELIRVRRPVFWKNDWDSWRVDFLFGTFAYRDISVTDYELIARLESLNRTQSLIDRIESKRAWLLTVSLTEEFHGRHWQVVAAGIPFPPE